MPEQASLSSLGASLKSAGLTHQPIDGVPTWMAATGVALIVLMSHLWVNAKKQSPLPARTAGHWHWNLFRLPFLGRLVKLSYFPFVLQSISVFLLLLVISAGLFGNERNNIGPVLTWTWWWALLIFFVLGFGEVFCMICPWEALSSWITSLSLKSRVKRLSYDLPWPKWARNVVPATVLFVVLTWFELGHDITHSASMTAILGLTMTGAAILTAIVFEKRAFCRYGCLVGRVSGLYSLFSPVELRPESAEVCKNCSSKACYHGTESTSGCPTNLFPGHLKENTYCTLCTECVRSCPHDNLALRVRPPATDLMSTDRFRWDEAFLAVVLLALTSFHGFTMTPVWNRLNQLLRADTGFGPDAVFSALMLMMLLIPYALFWTGAKVAAWGTRGSGVSAWRIFKAFAYSLIPIALFYHLAHNSMHFFMEAGALLPPLSDPFGFGWDLFGTATQHYGPLLSLPAVWWIQVTCIVTGHVYGVMIADRVAKRLFSRPGDRLRSLVPLLSTMVCYSCFSVWLISQPMAMKTAM